MSSSTVEFFHVLVSPGFEPGTSRTLAKRATPRPTGKRKISKKPCHYKVQLLCEAKCIGILYRQVFSANFPLLVGLEVARSARVREVLGSNPGETRT